MTIEALINAITPPEIAFDAFDSPWEPIEAELGTPLPPDYKDFIRLYGCGAFFDFLVVYLPRSSNPNVRLETQARVVCDAFRQIGDPPEPDAYPLWPDDGGLLPWGRTDNGDDLFWLARGEPSKWQVVIWAGGISEPEVFDCDLTGFLAGIATGEIVPEELPYDLRKSVPLFRPFPAGTGVPE